MSENCTPPSVPPPFQKIFSVLVGEVPEDNCASISHCDAIAKLPFQYEPSNPRIGDRFPLMLVAVPVLTKTCSPRVSIPVASRLPLGATVKMAAADEFSMWSTSALCELTASTVSVGVPVDVATKSTMPLRFSVLVLLFHAPKPPKALPVLYWMLPVEPPGVPPPPPPPHAPPLPLSRPDEFTCTHCVLPVIPETVKLRTDAV